MQNRTQCTAITGAAVLTLTLATSCARPSHAVAPPAAAESSLSNAGKPATRPSTIPSTPPASALTTPVGTIAFEDAKGGIKLDVPDWKRLDDKDHALTASEGARTLTLDVPDLPPHLPGFIPLNLVKNGFVDDLKKEHADLKITTDADAAVPSSKAREVQFEWADHGGTRAGVAVLIVHGDHVYVLRLDGDQAQANENKRIIDAAASSIIWEKAS